MLAKLCARLTYANVISTLALFLALGGGAAWGIGRSIPGPDGTIHACYAINGGTLRVIDSDASCKLLEKKLSWNQKGAKGDPGPKGDQGAKGDPGPPGSGFGGLQVTSDLVEVPAGSARWAKALAWCPEGKKVIGGGGTATEASVGGLGGLPVYGVVVYSSKPISTLQQGWQGHAQEVFPLKKAWVLVAYAVCASVG